MDQYAEAYDDQFCYSLDNRLLMNWYPHRIINSTNGNSLLELGIGHGYSTLIFSERYSRYLVIEGSQEIINNFRTKNSSIAVEINHGFFETFDTEEKFDVIVMGFILEHVDDPRLLLRKYKKFLAPGGSIYIAVPNGEALNRRIGYHAGLLSDMISLSEADLQLGHQRVFTVGSLKSIVIEEGYNVEFIEGLFLKPITTQQMIDLKLSEEILRGMLQAGVEYPELSVGILMKIKVD